jgi:hypothetical protein
MALMAKYVEFIPCFTAHAQASAHTAAVCEDGIPPVPKKNSIKENFFILKTPVIALKICATSHPLAALIKG